MKERIGRFLMVLAILTTLFASQQPPMVAHAATDCANEAATGIPQAECEALVALYNSTNGPNWTNNTGWNVTNTPCSWHGVTCSGGRVTVLDLRNNQLSGSIPPQLGNLSNLTYLYLYTNQLSGSIPPNWAISPI